VRTVLMTEHPQGDGDPAGAVGGEVLGMPSLGEAVGGLAAALGQGRVLAREAVQLGEKLVRVVLGRSEVAPGEG
jgi:hypothetical protein